MCKKKIVPTTNNKLGKKEKRKQNKTKLKQVCAATFVCSHTLEATSGAYDLTGLRLLELI